MSDMSDMYEQQMMNAEVQPQDGGAAARKVKLMGRERAVVKMGRSSYVVIKGAKVPLSKAKEMDKEYRKAKKEKEAAKKAKAASKKTAKKTKKVTKKAKKAKKAE